MNDRRRITLEDEQREGTSAPGLVAFSVLLTLFFGVGLIWAAQQWPAGPRTGDPGAKVDGPARGSVPDTAPLSWSLGLRIADGAVAAGDTAAVVLHTDAPLGLSSGTVVLRGGPPVLRALREFEVFGQEADVTSEGSYDPETGLTRLTFSSPSAGVNFDAGPLAVLFYQTSETVSPGTGFELSILAEETRLVVDEEQLADLAPPGSGSFEVLSPSAPLELGLKAGVADPGGTVDVAVVTRRSMPLAKGELVLLFDPEIHSEGVEFVAEYRYGTVQANPAGAGPGRIRLGFRSPVGDLNRIPGEILRLRLPVVSSARPGATGSLRLGAASWVETVDGGRPELDRVSGEVEVRVRAEVFSDDFEGGVLRRWRQVVPAP